MATKNFGIDLSAWNEVTDYDKLLSSTYGGKKIKYAFLRLGWLGTVDSRFKQHYKGLSGKVYIGVYVYSYARSVEAAKREARWALNLIKGLGITFPVVFDYEDKLVLSPKLSRAEYTAICKAFLDEIRAAGYYAMLYANPSFLEGYADKAALLEYPLWLAHYVPDGKQAQYGQKIWQFGTFRPAGVSGEVDANFAYEQLAKVIREGGLNVPVKYRLTAQKSVYAWELDEEKKNLAELGCTVTTKKI